jgi:serine/threonine protein kinase
MEHIAVPTSEELLESGIPATTVSIIDSRRKTPRPWPQGPLYPNVTDEAIDLLNGLLCFGQNKRLTARQAMEHEYFQGLATARVPGRIRLPQSQWVMECLSPANAPRDIYRQRMLEITRWIRARNFLRDPQVSAVDFIQEMERELLRIRARALDKPDIYGSIEHVDNMFRALACCASHFLKFAAVTNIDPQKVNAGGRAPYNPGAGGEASTMEM